MSSVFEVLFLLWFVLMSLLPTWDEMDILVKLLTYYVWAADDDKTGFLTVLSYSDTHTLYANILTQTSISSPPDNKYSTKNQNKNNTSNTDDIYSCVTPK